MSAVYFTERGRVANVNINQVKYFTITYPDKDVQMSYVQLDDDEDHFEKLYTGPLRLNENLRMCIKCGHYRSRRVPKCNNPGCKHEVIDKNQLIEKLVTEFKEKNGHILSCNGIRFKP